MTDEQTGTLTSAEPVAETSDYDAAVAAVDELRAAEADPEPEPDGEPAPDGEVPEDGAEPDDKADEAEPEPDKDDDKPDEGEGDGEPSDAGSLPEKKSAAVREAHRRQRSAERKLKAAQELEARTAERIKALDARDHEWTTFESELKRNPLQAIAKRMEISVPRLIAAYGEDGQGEVPEAVSLEIQSLRDEVKGLREEREQRDKERAKREHEANYQRALDSDARMLAEMVDAADVSERYPYFSALPAKQRASKARALQDYIVRNMPNPTQYNEHDLLEALDAKERARISALEKSGVITWHGRKRKAAEDDGDDSKPRRPRTPSARRAAAPAPATRNMTDEQSFLAAAKIVDDLRSGKA